MAISRPFVLMSLTESLGWSFREGGNDEDDGARRELSAHLQLWGRVEINNRVKIQRGRVQWLKSSQSCVHTPPFIYLMMSAVSRTSEWSGLGRALSEA